MTDAPKLKPSLSIQSRKPRALYVAVKSADREDILSVSAPPPSGQRR